MYGATSGDWKRSYDKWTEAPASPATATPHRQRPPRQSSTLPILLRHSELILCVTLAQALIFALALSVLSSPRPDAPPPPPFATT
jgi:hypothetical protein